ncbi:MAG: CMD domain protein [Acetobacteraceae bacterium]|nr:CMD domain protein [Acetobacteraceae bacterium]
MSQPDVIDLLVGITAGCHLDGLRAQRVQARDNAQASYLALFHPAEPVDISLVERYAVAVFVAGLHRQPAITAFYRAGLAAQPDLRLMLDAEIARGATAGPYGHYPAGPLSAEDKDGPTFTAITDVGPRLAAALAHAHMLVFHPRDASADALRTLEAAAWSATGIVTLSQLVAFLSFQIRVIIGLRALAKAS